MASQTSTAEIAEFMASPIVTWFASCLGESVKDHQLTYEELVDGVLIYDVFLQMDIDGQSNDVSPSQNNPSKLLANLETVMRHIRQFYEDFGEVILYPPHIHLIAQEPYSNIREVELLLVLLLGCAVKCRNNEHFVQRITLLDDHTQATIASYISKVLHFPDIVLSKEMLLIESTEDKQQLSHHKKKVQKAFKEIRRMNKERNELLVQLRSASLPHNEVHSCEKELNEWKAEAMALNDQLDDCKCKLAAMETENKKLASEAKSCRDALEDISDKVQQNEQIDQEIVGYKEKLRQMAVYKIRFDELEQNNQSLREKKDELADQLEAYKGATDKKMREMEMEIFRLQQKCSELAIENEMSYEQNSRLYEENADLERRIKLSASINITLDNSFESDESINTYNNSSICEQLSQSVQSQALKLELESRRLETLQENTHLESSLQILDLEKQKKRLEFLVEDLNAKVRQLERNLALANNGKTQSGVLSDNAEGLASGESESRAAVLESEEKMDEKLITEEPPMKLPEENEDDCEDDDLNTSTLKSPVKHEVKYEQLYSEYQRVLQERNSLKKKLREAKFKLTQHSLPDSSSEISQEHANLRQDFSLLMFEYRKEKWRADELLKRHKLHKEELYSKSSKLYEYDMNNVNLLDHCKVLTELNKRLEYDKRMTNRYIWQMLRQNQQLAEKSYQRLQQFHEEKRQNNEKLNNLTRTKTKLEEKVMCHYRNIDYRREPKNRNGAVKAVKKTIGKVRRAGSELFGIGRRWSFAGVTDNGCNTTQASGFQYIATPRKSDEFFKNFSPEDFSFNEEENELLDEAAQII